MRSVRINPIVKILILSDFIIWSSANLVAPLFAIFIIDQIPGTSILTVGIAAALYVGIRSLVEIPISIIIDKTKSEKDDLYTTVMGSVLGAIVFFMYMYVDSVSQLYALQVLLGVSAAFSYPGWSSIFTHHLDKRHEVFEWSVYDVMLGLGMAVTAVLGSFIVYRFGFSMLFVVAGFSSLIGALVLLLVQNKIK